MKLSEELYLTFTIDSFTVNPLFFEGGSIGKLAADGTINDLVVSGAKPIALFDAIEAEEGIEFDVVERAVSDMIEEAKQADVAILGGDFKVMPRGEISKMVITTAGFGLAKHPITNNKIVPGDKNTGDWRHWRAWGGDRSSSVWVGAARECEKRCQHAYTASSSY